MSGLGDERYGGSTGFPPGEQEFRESISEFILGPMTIQKLGQPQVDSPRDSYRVTIISLTYVPSRRDKPVFKLGQTVLPAEVTKHMTQDLTLHA
jgi:hypothetical protein